MMDRSLIADLDALLQTSKGGQVDKKVYLDLYEIFCNHQEDLIKERWILPGDCNILIKKMWEADVENKIIWLQALVAAELLLINLPSSYKVSGKDYSTFPLVVNSGASFAAISRFFKDGGGQFENDPELCKEIGFPIDFTWDRLKDITDKHEGHQRYYALEEKRRAQALFDDENWPELIEFNVNHRDILNWLSYKKEPSPETSDFLLELLFRKFGAETTKPFEVSGWDNPPWKKGDLKGDIPMPTKQQMRRFDGGNRELQDDACKEILSFLRPIPGPDSQSISSKIDECQLTQMTVLDIVQQLLREGDRKSYDQVLTFLKKYPGVVFSLYLGDFNSEVDPGGRVESFMSGVINRRPAFRLYLYSVIAGLSMLGSAAVIIFIDLSLYMLLLPINMALLDSVAKYYSILQNNAKQFNGEKRVRGFSPDLIRATRPVVAHEPRSINPRASHA